ncbi:MAG: ATP-binding protein, partial [Chloroflexi bacterium]|nr:ATP-binding protein [Chloroflexota bacterium]
MSIEDEKIPSSETNQWTKSTLEWLTWIGAVGAALTTVIGVFVPSEVFAKQAAFAIALVLGVIFGVALYYRRRRAARAFFKEPLPPADARAALRFLLPFEEGDELPGRAGEAQDLYTMVSSTGFRFGVLCGESGSGKTSLLRAGVLSRLRAHAFLPLYIPNIGKDPLVATRSALAKMLPVEEPESANDDLRDLLRSTARQQDKTLVIIFDQFEEFFVTNRTLHEPFLRWIGDCVQDTTLPVIFLLSLRSDFFIRMRDFAPFVPEPISVNTMYELRNFDLEQAKMVLHLATKQDGIVFERGLVNEIANDLMVDSLIRPAELQIVATRLKRRRIYTLTGYEISGRALGLLSSYITEEVDGSADPTMAKLLLRLLCPAVDDTRRSSDRSIEDILHSVQDSDTANTKVSQERVRTILGQLIGARIIVQTEEGKFNLVHDYLVPY